jgi:hypothetical protein
MAKAQNPKMVGTEVNMPAVTGVFVKTLFATSERGKLGRVG